METYFSNMKAQDGTREKLVEDLLVLVHDAEELVKATGTEFGSKSKDELSAALARVKAGCRALQSRASVGARQADQLVRQHPYQSIGVALGLGLLIGVLVNRD